MTDTPSKPRGLAAMSPERRREIASMGGKASPNRPFRDVPGAAIDASKKALDARRNHDNSRRRNKEEES